MGAAAGLEEREEFRDKRLRIDRVLEVRGIDAARVA